MLKTKKEDCSKSKIKENVTFVISLLLVLYLKIGRF